MADLTPEQQQVKDQTISQEKARFAQSAVQLAIIGRQLLSTAQTLRLLYFEKGYNSTGASPITDADLLYSGDFDTEDLTSFMTAVEQILTEAQAVDKQWAGKFARVGPSQL